MIFIMQVASSEGEGRHARRHEYVRVVAVRHLLSNVDEIKETPIAT